MIPYKKIFGPETNTDICIGCGACEHVCPAIPEKAIIIEGNEIHKVNKAANIGEIDENLQEKIIEKNPSEEDFPF